MYKFCTLDFIAIKGMYEFCILGAAATGTATSSVANLKAAAASNLLQRGPANGSGNKTSKKSCAI